MSDTYCRDCVQHVIHGAGDVEFCPRHAAMLALVDEMAKALIALSEYEDDTNSWDLAQAALDRYKALTK